MLNIAIHNLHPGLELTSPVYFSTGTTCHVFPNHETDTGTTANASFEIGSKQKDFKGVLLYKLRRKYANRTKNWSNSRAISIKRTRSIYLSVFWNIFGIEGYYHGFYVCLIECDNDFTWDEDKLWALRYQYMNQINEDYNYLAIMWLMSDGALIRTRQEIIYGSDCKLDIIIFEGSGKHNVAKPIRIVPEGSVLS
jgi:hypothetical protein